MELVVVVVLGAVAFLAGIAIVIAIVVGLLRPERIKDGVDQLRPSKRHGSG